MARGLISSAKTFPHGFDAVMSQNEQTTHWKWINFMGMELLYLELHKFIWRSSLKH